MQPLTTALRTIAPYVGKDTTIILVVVGLIVWTTWSGVRLLRASRGLLRRFDQGIRLLAKASDPESFSQSYETVSLELERDVLLGTPWRGYRNTLIIPRSAGRPIVATVDPRTWFDLAALFRDAKADLRYHAALPGLLVGAGLLYTFLGLAAALSLAGDVVQSGDDHARNAALHDLLGAASAKFITSLFGLLLSIIYALFRKWRLRVVELRFDVFLTALRKLLPFKTTAALQAEANGLLEKQYAEIQRVETEFVVSLGQVFDTALNNGLGQHVGPLSAAIDRLAQGLGSQNQDAIDTMLKSFIERLEGAVGESMRGTAETLERLGARLDGLQGGLDGAAIRMSKAAADMATGLGRGMDTALADMTERMGELVASLRQAAEETGRSNRAASDDAARTMKDAADSLTMAVATFRQQMQDGAAQSVGQLAQPIQALLAQLGSLAERQQEVGAQASEALAATLGRAAAALETTTAQVADTLGGGAADASARLVAASEAMRDDLRAVLRQFGTTLDQSGSAMVESAERGGKALAGAAVAVGEEMAVMAAELRDAGLAAGTALRDGGAAAGNGRPSAASLLTRGGDSLGSRIAALGQSADMLMQQGDTLRLVAGSATTPLQASAADLRQAAETTRAAAEPLAQTVQAVRLAVEELTRTSTMFEATQRQSGELTSRLAAASDRFEGLDVSIAHTLQSLGEGVDEISRRLTGFVVDVDKSLAQSVKHLSGMTQSLDSGLADLNDNLARVRTG